MAAGRRGLKRLETEKLSAYPTREFRMECGDDAVRKIMSATPADLERGLAIVLGRDVRVDELPLRVALEAGYVDIAREALDGIRLGGLLELPRSAVTLTFAGTRPELRADFLRRFDLAFQRGGG